MAKTELVKHLLGVSSEEIGEAYTTSKSAAEVDKIIAYELGKIRDGAIKKILDAAKTGDVAAVVWLESHGFLVFPGEYTTAN